MQSLLQKNYSDLGIDLNFVSAGTSDLGLSAGNNDVETHRYYFTSDHIGSSNVITDASGTPVQQIEYMPFGESYVDWRELSWNTPYRFTGKEQDPETGLYYYGVRYYDAKIGRFMSVDPLAEKFAAWSPYTYTLDNPVRLVDRDGMEAEDWYQNNDGEQVWFNNRDAFYVDDDGVEWSNIGEERLYFGGKNLIYYTQSEDEDGNLTLNMEVFDAVSGRNNGGFDYSEENQAAKGSGPIPEGDYSINPSLVQSYSDLSFAQKAASIIGRGQWPGGRFAWGENRVWIEPSSVEVTNPETGETVTRTDMSIHGGSVPGSAGCIDCSKDAPRFFNSLSKSEQRRIPLRVKYRKSKKK